MIQRLKSIKQFIEIGLNPRAYKAKFFTTINALNWKNIQSKNIENELLIIQEFIDKDSIFIDVGANLGQYLFVVEKTIKPSNIFAFEPHPKLKARLKKLFKGIHIISDALSDSEGKTQFKIPYFKGREIHTRGTLKTQHLEVDETHSVLIDVNITTLDIFTRRNDIKDVTVIKIDVEGAEFDVVNGAKSLIKQSNPILIIEIEQRHHQDNILDFIFNFERDFNYTCYYFDAMEQTFKNDLRNRKIEDLQSQENHGKNRGFINNFIFIPNTGKNQKDIAAISAKIKQFTV